MLRSAWLSRRLASAVGAIQLGCGAGWRIIAWVLLWSSLGGTTDELSCSAATDGYSEFENRSAYRPVQRIGRFEGRSVFFTLAAQIY